MKPEPGDPAGSEAQLPQQRPAVSVTTGGAIVAAGLITLNVAAYGLTLIAAHLLGPSDFGQFSALLGLLVVLGVAGLGMQATAARALVQANAASRHDVEHQLAATSWRVALVVATGCTLAAPLLMRLLRVDSWLAIAALVVAVTLLSHFGVYAGILQGRTQWRALAVVHAMLGIARLAFGTAALLISRDPTMAMIGVAVALLPCVLLARILVTRQRNSPRRGAGDPHPGPRAPSALSIGPVLREAAHNTHAMLAFFTVSNIDLVLARAVLDQDVAGQYAAGSVLAKAVLFLPQFVIVVAFPLMSARAGTRHTEVWSLTLVAALGAIVVAGVALLPSVALAFVGGAEYAPVGPQLWLFAILGTLLAMTQLLVYSAVAQRQRGSLLLPWLTTLALCLWGWHATTEGDLLTIKLVVHAALLLLWGAVLLRGRGDQVSVPPSATRAPRRR